MVIINQGIKDIYMYIYIRFTITCYEYSIALLTGSVRPQLSVIQSMNECTSHASSKSVHAL